MSTKYLNPEYYQSDSLKELIPALIGFQKAFNEIKLKKDAKNDHLKNSYLTLNNLTTTIRPILTDNGLVVVQSLAGGNLTTVLYHSSGEFIGSNMPFNPMSGNRGTNALQEVGGGISYARRYSLSALLQISVDEDTDGNGSKMTYDQLSNPKKESNKQRKKVETMEQVYKIIDWLIEDISRRESLTKIYDISSEHLQFIDYELQTRL
jgi:hypothetical protein